MHIKPSPGVVVRDPYTRRPLPPEGAEVPDHDSFYLRRLTDGDVVRVAQGGERRSPVASKS
ncbi:MAG: DUF2635 domain-containing protein [Rhodospirillales bacterium]|nr:DUF2635 domain-containing protein [Rhodospirillales bacterium]